MKLVLSGDQFRTNAKTVVSSTNPGSPHDLYKRVSLDHVNGCLWLQGEDGTVSTSLLCLAKPVGSETLELGFCQVDGSMLGKSLGTLVGEEIRLDVSDKDVTLESGKVTHRLPRCSQEPHFGAVKPTQVAKLPGPVLAETLKAARMFSSKHGGKYNTDCVCLKILKASFTILASDSGKAIFQSEGEPRHVYSERTFYLPNRAVKILPDVLEGTDLVMVSQEGGRVRFSGDGGSVATSLVSAQWLDVCEKAVKKAWKAPGVGDLLAADLSLGLRAAGAVTDLDEDLGVVVDWEPIGAKGGPDDGKLLIRGQNSQAEVDFQVRVPKSNIPEVRLNYQFPLKVTRVVSKDQTISLGGSESIVVLGSQLAGGTKFHVVFAPIART